MRETIVKLFPNISEEKIDKLILFYKLILSYNSHTNITRITNDKEYIYKHIFDSVWPIINNEEIFKGKKILDVGSGGGFPGIPIMIMYPGIKVDFIDFNIKKIRFLRLALKELGLDSDIYYQNVIDFGISSPKSYDIIIARAFKNLSNTITIVAPLLKLEGRLYSYKGIKFLEEIEFAEDSIKKHQLYIHSIMKNELPERYGFRSIIILKKLNKGISHKNQKVEKIWAK